MDMKRVTGSGSGVSRSQAETGKWVKSNTLAPPPGACPNAIPRKTTQIWQLANCSKFILSYSRIQIVLSTRRQQFVTQFVRYATCVPTRQTRGHIVRRTTWNSSVHRLQLVCRRGFCNTWNLISPPTARCRPSFGICATGKINNLIAFIVFKVEMDPAETGNRDTTGQNGFGM